MTCSFNIQKPQNVCHKDKWKDMLLKELAHTYSYVMVFEMSLDV